MRRTPGSVDTSDIVHVCRHDDGVDQSLLREMLTFFIVENRRRVDQATAAVADDDRDRLRQLAHAIRGSAAMIGAGRLHDLASALEHDAGAAQREDLRVAVGAMSTEFHAVYAALRAEHPDAVS